MITKEPQPGDRIEFSPDGWKTTQYAGTVVHCNNGICYLCDETKPNPQSQREYWGNQYRPGWTINNAFIWRFREEQMNTMHRVIQ